MKLWCKKISDNEIHKSWSKESPGNGWFELPRDTERDERVEFLIDKVQIQLQDRDIDGEKKQRIIRKIREEYSVDDEIALLNNKEDPEYATYRAYVDQCKLDVTDEIEQEKIAHNEKKKNYPIFIEKSNEGDKKMATKEGAHG